MSNTDERRMSPSSKKADTFCWTCRRRRIICDKTLPTCLKCKKANKECLGYTKPLKWNDGVASRGKMMGKSFPKPQPTEPAQIVTEDFASPDTIEDTPSIATVASDSEKVDDDTSTELMEISPQVFFPIGNVLKDPVFQDMKPITRYYLDYCK
jgi:hypothetical protein